MGRDKKGIIGTLSLTRGGYGFVEPEEAGRPHIYIPATALGGALPGDLVEVELQRSSDPLRPSGKVMAIKERRQSRFVACLLANGMAKAEDACNPYVFAVEKLPKNAKPGMKVLLSISRFPSEGGTPAGKIVEVLGPAGEPDTETAAILASYDVPLTFPPAVKRAARSLACLLTDAEREQRLDLTGLATFTIDPDDARDYDDALSCEERPDGTIVVGVHIADVAYYVRPGTALDEEARRRSTSIYLPERVIPMLPEEISNDICSLRPSEMRITKTVFLHYDQTGRRRHYSIHRSFIRSHQRFTYRQVKELISGERRPCGRVAELMPALRRLHDLAQRLRQGRIAAGSIELDLPEFKIVLDEKGRAMRLERCEHDFSHQLVEEFMLAANQAVAEWCFNNRMSVLYRVHEPPDNEDLLALAHFLRACGYPCTLPLRRERLNEILRACRGRSEEHAIHLAALKSFQQAIYDSRGDIGHYALNFTRYLHFTSPIRRYPDLHVHRMLDMAFAQGGHHLPQRLRLPPAAMDNLVLLGQHASRQERLAMKVEEEVKDFRRLEILSRSAQREFNAVVTGIKDFGVFVEIADYFVEGLLPRQMLESKGFVCCEEMPGRRPLPPWRRRPKPGFHLGQVVRVRLLRVDLAARRSEMEFLGLAGDGKR